MHGWGSRAAGRLGRTALVALAAAAAACGVSGPLTGSASDEWVRTYDLPAGGSLDITNTNGGIDVEAGDGPTVEVRAERIVKSTTDEAAREVLGRVSIVEDVEENRVAIRTEGLDGLVIGVNLQVRYHVRAPRGLAVHLTNTNGAISIAGLEGPVEARTTNGGVTATGLAGGLQARTTNGGLRVTMARVSDAPIDLHATNGGVLLELPESAAADLSLSATNGGVSVAGLSFEPVGEQTRRRIKGRLNGGGTSIDLSTTNGGVRVRSRSASAAQPEL